jgi:DNA modification methylase
MLDLTSRMASRIDLWPVDKLVPYDQNPRTHSEEQIGQIAASILQFGFLNPILIDTAAGIIAGHGRLQAALKLGLAQVPVVVLDHLTDTEKRAYVIADNKLALNAGWDDELLRKEMTALADENFDLDVLGFDSAELDEIMFSDEEDTADEDDAVPETPEEPISKKGDLWKLGDHLVLCGDATVITDVEKVMDGQLADMVFTDPPYNVDYANTTKEKIRGKARPILNDNLGADFGQFLYDAITGMLTVTKGALYICMSTRELPTLHTAFEKAGGKWSDYLVWAKHMFTMGGSDYQRQYEPILYGWKQGSDHYWCGARDQGNVLFVKKPSKNTLHPTMKPVELIERVLKNSSKSRDIVLDCSGGSGSTMIACEKLGRQCRMIELDPKYVDVIVKRWEEFTGKKGELLTPDQDASNHS